MSTAAHRPPSYPSDATGALEVLEARFRQLEPQVSAFVPEAYRFVRLRRAGEELAERFPDPKARPALYGVPVGIKDIIRVEGLPTQAGNRLPPELFQGAEADCVRRLRQAGALVLGKTVTAEFAYLAPGPTRNPRHPAHTPGGSSSGSAAAVAAGLCPVALGTQTVGSINRPAAYCGVLGFKPSFGRIDTEGVLPLAPSTDHVGFCAWGFEWVRRVCRVLIPDWLPPEPELRRPVLGIAEGDYLACVEPAALAVFQSTVGRLQRGGYTIRHVPLFADFADWVRAHHLLVAAEAAQVHRDWYARFAARYRSETAELIERGRGVDAAALAGARAALERQRRQVMEHMSRYAIDAWITPAATGPAPRGLARTGDSIMQLPWTQAGLPCLNLPAGQLAGLPLGLQLGGGWCCDERVIEWGAGIYAALAGLEP